jgi:hypothetical protein
MRAMDQKELERLWLEHCAGTDAAAYYFGRVSTKQYPAESLPAICRTDLTEAWFRRPSLANEHNSELVSNEHDGWGQWQPVGTRTGGAATTEEEEPQQ